MVGIVLQNRFPPFWYFLLFVLLCVSVFLSGCGELTLPVGAGGFVAAENAVAGGIAPGGVAPGVAESATKAVSEAEFAGFRRIIESDVYDGKLTVFLRKDIESWEYPSIISEKYAGVKPVRKTDLMTAEEKEDRRRWEEANGMKLFDWGRVYYFEVADREKALALQRDLMSRPEVWLVYPGQRGFGAHAGDGTPSLVDRQIYLGSADEAGLEVEHAWEQGIYGQGVGVDFRDGGFFEAHEDFRLLRGLECGIEDVGRNGLCTYSGIAHGTATAGLIHAKHQHEEVADEHGMRGIAPDSALYQGVGRGDILVKEEALPFGLNENSRRWVSCQHDDFGEDYGSCVPIIAAPDSYIAVRERALLRDIITMIPVANGAINLDAVEFVSEELRGSVCAGAADEAQRADCERHSQFVLAGAHQGDRGMVEVEGQRRPVKWQYSNCGREVELASWGERVVTTAWRHPDGSAVRGYDWDGPNGPPNDAPERAYTNQFGGTSAGAALVAGAAALVQSYFKDLAEGVAGDGLFAKTRYLRPAKLKEILIASGLPVESADGCGVGVQPRISEAFRLVREYWGDVRQRFPELEGQERLTLERGRVLLREGFGMECYAFGPAWDEDPLCPSVNNESWRWDCDRDNPGVICLQHDILPHLARKMDFDEDGRGDLVSWEPGVWRIDLSEDPEGDSPEDNYGEWDITLAYPVTSRWEVPVVEDYDSDGKADLALYDRERGRWLIAITTERTLRGIWDGWTYEVAWPLRGDSGYWEEEFYTRPLPADYNGDGWVDLAVQTSDGRWAINFAWRTGRRWERVGRRFLEFGPLMPEYQENAVGRWLSPGIWDLAYLTAEELAAYPGWAYLPSSDGGIVWRRPSGEVYSSYTSGSARAAWGDPFLGGLENIPVFGDFTLDGVGAKRPDGMIQFIDLELEVLAPGNIYGDVRCKPMVSDLDGDESDDMTVMCPDEWRIVNSGDRFDHQNNGGGFRHVHLSYTDPKALPGTPAFGGLSYERITRVREFLRNSGAREAEPFFDYAMHPFDYCALGWEEAERPEECL